MTQFERASPWFLKEHNWPIPEVLRRVQLKWHVSFQSKGLGLSHYDSRSTDRPKLQLFCGGAQISLFCQFSRFMATFNISSKLTLIECDIQYFDWPQVNFFRPLITSYKMAWYPILDTRISFVLRPSSFVRSSVRLRGPPLDSEMGWTGELWSKTKFLILEN